MTGAPAVWPTGKPVTVPSADGSSTSEQVATIGGRPVRTHDHVSLLYGVRTSGTR